MSRRIFSRIFSPDFFSSFLWGKIAQKNPPGKSPGKSSQIYTTKILQNIPADCPAQEFPPESPSRTGRVAQSWVRIAPHPVSQIVRRLFPRPFFGGTTKSGTKNQPKEEVLGADILRTSGGHARGCPGPKLRSGRSKSWKHKHFGADIPDPKARPSTTPRDFQKLWSEKLWAEFSFPTKETKTPLVGHLWGPTLRPIGTLNSVSAHVSKNWHEVAESGIAVA